MQAVIFQVEQLLISFESLLYPCPELLPGRLHCRVELIIDITGEGELIGRPHFRKLGKNGGLNQGVVSDGVNGMTNFRGLGAGAADEHIIGDGITVLGLFTQYRCKHINQGHDSCQGGNGQNGYNRGDKFPSDSHSSRPL